jgi:hypothetical protein
MSLLSQPTISSADIKTMFKDSVTNEKRKTLSKDLKSKRLIDTLLKEDYTAIQLLIFHYLGFTNNISLTNVKKAKVLSIVFKTKGSENIRKKLSNIGGIQSKYMTIKNLEVVRDLFQELGYSEPLKKVEADIIKKQPKKLW